MTESELQQTVERMLESETFEPAELKEVLIQRGHAEAEVSEAIERVTKALASREQSPAQKTAELARRRAGRLLRAGILIFIVGLGFTYYFGGGILQLLLVLAIGGAFVAAGYRGSRGR